MNGTFIDQMVIANTDRKHVSKAALIQLSQPRDCDFKRASDTG